MGCDMAVALGPTTVSGTTLFGLNYHQSGDENLNLVFSPGKEHAPDEAVRIGDLELPQCRNTRSVLALQENEGWGYPFGVNDKGVVLGLANWQSLFDQNRNGLEGSECVRLVLERVCNAHQAVDLLTNLIGRHGQTSFHGASHQDSIFLIADSDEAYVLEAAGSYWTYQEIHRVRAVSDVGVIRRDWNRISPGLAEYAVENGWAKADGNKLDFVGTISANPVGRSSALRRWGRSTFMLESQSGNIDNGFFRRLLGDHYEDTSYEVDPTLGLETPVPLCRHGHGPRSLTTRCSLMVEPAAISSHLPMAWFAFGPPCLSVYFPVFFLPNFNTEGYFIASHTFRSRNIWQSCARLQNLLACDEKSREYILDRLIWLQNRIDQDTEEFFVEAQELANQTAGDELYRRADYLMRNHLEQMDHIVEEISPHGNPVSETELVLW